MDHSLQEHLWMSEVTLAAVRDSDNKQQLLNADFVMNRVLAALLTKLFLQERQLRWGGGPAEVEGV